MTLRYCDCVACRSREAGSESYGAPFVHPRLGVFAPNGPNPDPLTVIPDDLPAGPPIVGLLILLVVFAVGLGVGVVVGRVM